MTKKTTIFFRSKSYILLSFLIICIISIGIKGCKDENPLPIITGISPDCSSEHGGVEITITGKNFGDGKVSRINFGSTIIPETDFKLSHTPKITYSGGERGGVDHIRFKNPPGNPGDIIEVSVSGEVALLTITSNKFEFSYEASPQITEIIPASGSTDGGTEVKIIGSLFTSPCIADLGGAPIDDLKVNSDPITGETTITGVTTSHDPGNVNLNLTCTPEDCPVSDVLQGFEYIGAGVTEHGNTIPIGGTWQYVEIGDITNDHQNDIVVASYDRNTGAAKIVSIDGATYKETIIDLPSGSSPRGIVLADFDPVNNNGLDVALALEGLNQVAVLINDGNGFENSPPFLAINIGNSPYGITTGDFDKDGYIDDLAAPNLSGASFSIILGNDDGTFSSNLEFEVISNNGTASPNAITSGNFFGSGISDIGLVSSTTDEAYVFYNTSSDGDISFYQDILVVQNKPLSVISGDFSNDELDDIAAINNASNTLSFHEQFSTGGFDSHYFIPIDDAPFVMTRGNFGPNGWLVIGYRGASNLFELRDGLIRKNLYKLMSTADELILSIAAGDLDNDGIDDLVFGMEDGDSIVIVLSSLY